MLCKTIIYFFIFSAEPSKTSMVNRKRSSDSLNEKSRSETLGESSKIAKTDYDDDDDFFIEANHDDNYGPGTTKILENLKKFMKFQRFIK